MLCLFYTESMCRFFKQRIFELSFEYFVTVCNTKNKKASHIKKIYSICIHKSEKRCIVRSPLLLSQI